MRGDNALPAAAPRVVVITGASRGLGAALALSYAAPGRVLGLLARQEDRLEEVAAACRNRGSRVETGVVDVQDHSTIQAWFDAFDTSHPIDLLIVNAGVYTGHGDDGAKESLGEAVWLIRINLEGAIACAYAVLPGMRARHRPPRPGDVPCRSPPFARCAVVLGQQGRPGGIR